MQKQIFFFGTPEIAVPSLEKIANLSEFKIVGVGVFPDRPVGRKKIQTACPVKISAQKLNLPIFEISRKTDLLDLVETIDFDLGLVIAFGLIFPSEILDKKDFVNVHFSLLPEYRGASPVQSAILNREKESGITWQKMVKKLDAGNILYQKKFSIVDKNTAEIWSDFAQKTAEICPQFLSKFFNSELKETKQDDKKATFCSKFKKEDGEIFPSTETADQIFAKYLAFNPWPIIFMKTKFGNLKLWKISREKTDKNFELKCAENSSLYLEKVQLSGKSPVNIREFINGYGQFLVLP